MRRILHIDMDAFFAAVEEQRHPELKGKPVVIGGSGDPKRRGVVSTASYEARKFGIYSGMPLRTAYRLCPDAIFLPVHYEAYARVSARVKAILREISPTLEDAGIDEAYLDISENPSDAAEIASEIKTRIRKETGLTCSIGIAPNKLLAKIASDVQKPDGLTILSEAEIPTRIWPLSVRKIPGVGPRTEACLNAMGIRTIGELAARSPEELVSRLGKAHGSFLHQSAWGIDETPLITEWEPKSRSREITFQMDIGNRQRLIRTLDLLSRQVAEGMKQEGYQGRTVTLKVRFSDFETHTRQVTLTSPTDAYEIIRKAALDCLGRIELKKKVRLLGIRLGELESP